MKQKGIILGVFVFALCSAVIVAIAFFTTAGQNSQNTQKETTKVQLEQSIPNGSYFVKTHTDTNLSSSLIENIDERINNTKANYHVAFMPFDNGLEYSKTIANGDERYVFVEILSFYKMSENNLWKLNDDLQNWTVVDNECFDAKLIKSGDADYKKVSETDFLKLLDIYRNK